MADDKEDGEKLFSSEKAAEAQATEVSKFTPENESRSAVSSIRIETVKSKFTGLTKEELMKYAKDPFWIRIRWFLFILFWLIWFLMLFGAIFVIIVTPKCKESPPPEWWQRSSLYKADVFQLAAENYSVIDLLQKHIDYLNDIGVETLLLESVLKASSNAPKEILNFTDVNPLLKNVDAFKKDVVDYARRKGIHIIISFVPDYSGITDFFERSALKEDKFFETLYVWHPNVYSAKPEKAPNNWLSVYNTSAWEWHDGRKQFYLHQFNASEPEFNFRNPNVVKFFNDIFKYWLNVGADGFHLEHTEYLVEDSEFRDEAPRGNTSYGFNEYGYYFHHRTFELPETSQVLTNWSSVIRNASGILSVSGGVMEKKEIANFVLRPLYLSPNFTAKELDSHIWNWKNSVDQPTWQWNCLTDMKQCFPESAIDGLFMISFLLPGTPVLKLGQEFGYENVFDANGKIDEQLWKKVYTNQSADPESHFNTIKKLIKTRETPSVTYGSFNSTILNGTVFAFTRIKPGNPGYLVAWNVGRDTVTVNFREFSAVPEDFMIIQKSGRLFKDLYPLKSRIYSSNVQLPALAAAVFSFVPALK